MEWVLVFPLIPMIIQDFKYRRVSLLTIILFGVLQICVCVWKYGIAQTGYNMLANMICLVIISTFVSIYAFFRFRKNKRLIGAGDIIFLLLLSPYFLLPFLLYFLIGSCLVALIGWGIGALFRKNTKKTIPLISYLGICYLLVILLSSL